MRRALAASSLFLLAGFAPAQDQYAGHIAKTGPRTPDEERRLFRLPPGYEVQLVASEPDIHKPMNIAFDARGRLWVTESVEYPFPVPDDKKGRDSVKILEDFGPDGKARKITTYAGGLNIPIGLLPLHDGAMVYSIPNIWRLHDDGKREVFLGPFGHRDTHGMTNAFTWGFDGWIYATHGFANDTTIRGKDGQAITMNSGNTYRMRPDGSHVEQFTWGQVNPFGLAFDPLGNLYSADCHTKPIMCLLRGGHYDSFGKPHDGLGYAPDMIDRYDDSTAIAGIAYYAADHFPPADRDCAYIGDVVTNCVNQFRLTWHGSTPEAKKVDFLRSDDPWFRPVDVKLGPDGALYVADFYNRIIGHYEVPLDHPGRDRERGRIWRVVYKGETDKGGLGHPPKDFTKASRDELINALRDPNLTVRMTAANQLVELGAIDKELSQHLAARLIRLADSPLALAQGYWVRERLGGLVGTTLASAASHESRLVRVHAMRILSDRTELSAGQRDLVLAGLKDKDAFVQRCAADALGRHPQIENLRPLLELRQHLPNEDTHLRHTVQMALRDTLKPTSAWQHLPELSEADRRAVADVALGVHTPEAAAWLLTTFKDVPRDHGQVVAVTRHIARYGSEESTKRLLARSRADRPDNLDYQHSLFRAIEQGTQERGGKLSDDAREWATDLAGRLLASTQGGLLTSGIGLAGSLRLESAQPRLDEIARTHQAPEDQRIAALNSLAAIDAGKHTALLGRVLADAAEPQRLREESSHILARINQLEAQAQLLAALPTVSAHLQLVIAADLAGSRSGGEKLLEAVAAGKASARLLQERVVAVRLEAAKVPDLKARLAKLTEGLPPADAKFQELFQRRREGFAKAKTDVALGAKVYEKYCANCHQLGGKGAKVGPQLDGIGARGMDRLMEDILDPNRNVDQAFRASTLALKNGTSLTGLVLREEGAVLIVADAQGKEVRVPKDQVEERSISPLSPMPASLAEQISEPDFYNLLAFLLTQRAKKD